MDMLLWYLFNNIFGLSYNEFERKNQFGQVYSFMDK